MRVCACACVCAYVRAFIVTMMVASDLITWQVLIGRYSASLLFMYQLTFLLS